eukprot:201860-Pelagomonas_calceolata.AAC.1
MASPSDYNTQYLNYWNSDPRDILFGARHNSLSSKFTGISICHPIYDDKAMTKVLQHAIYSAIINTEGLLHANLKDNNVTDTSIPNAGPGGNPFYKTAWLAREEEARLSTPESSSPIPNLVYFPDLKMLQNPICMINTGLDTQIARQAITLITRACYPMQTRALAMLSGTCHVSQFV